MEEARVLKEKGNAHFKLEEWPQAIDCYTQALKLFADSSDANVFYKNRAACYLKLENYEAAVMDCTRALELGPNDPKALFRRCQAYEALNKIEEAFVDAATLLRVDPKNTAIQPILKRLNPLVQEKAREQQSTDSKVSQMFKLAFDSSATDSLEKRKHAASNLIVLAREEAGAEKIFRGGGVVRLVRMVEEEREVELQVTAVRVLSCMCKDNKTRSLAVLREFTVKRVCVYMGSESADLSLAITHMLRNILLAVTDLDKIKEDRDKHEKARKMDRSTNMRPWFQVYDRIAADEMEVVDEIMPQVIALINQVKVSGSGRDNIIELLTKFITRKDGVGWSKRFIDVGGIRRALDVASVVPEHKTLPLTSSTHMHTSLLLQKVYDDLISDQERDAFRQATDDFFVDLFGDGLIESKLEAVMALAVLLQGPFDVGNAILGKPGVMEMLVAMADSGDLIHTKYAVEALVQSASKKDRCSGIIKVATPVLKALYQSPDDAIRVRALVGLCKLGSVGGADASAKSFAEGSTQTLAKACRKFLCNPQKDVDLKKWAAEGLAFLSLDADVKDDLVHDVDALKALFDLAKVADVNALYPIGQTLVNVTNSYDKANIEPEMLELAKFAKHHIPEEHEKDKEPHISERITLLVKAGVVGALVSLSKAESVNSRELLTRTFLAVCTKQEHRGLVVQQGGVKALISLALEGTELGRVKAAHALARIAISINPEMAFPGQRALEVVRPILLLLHMDRTGLENFEGLLALTNLTSQDDSVRKRVVSEKGVGLVEHWSYEEHEMIRRAAVECMCNLVMNDDVAALFKGENDRVKLLVLYCMEEDEALTRAAMGALAMLSHDPEICQKIVTCTEQWSEAIQAVSASPVPDLQYRGVYVLANLMAAEKSIAQRLVESTALEVLMAVSRLDDPERQQAQQAAKRALASAVEWGLIEKAPGL